MFRLIGLSVFAVLIFSAFPEDAGAQDRATCTAKCGGKTGGEAANSPAVVACFRKCMGVSGNSDSAGKKK
jgi:hypothetical protein